MSYSVTTLDGERKPRRLPARELDPIEIRVLGCLMEKQLATPEYYPLTLNALIAACNQKSNREPVMELGESEVQRALDRLQDEKLVWKVLGGRATRYDHNLDATWQLDRAAKAVMALLFLRGPQTAGELRSRSDRMHDFGAIEDIEATLQRLAPMTEEIPRRPGQKEARWMQMLSGAAPSIPSAEESAPESGREPLSIRVQRLEEQIAALGASSGGYVSESKQWREDGQLRASITLRIPAQRLDETLATARKLATRVESENVDANDVTQEYVDLDAQVRNLEAAENEMRQLMTDVRQRMKKAEDILEVYQHLTELRGQIEQAKGRMRYLSQLS